MKLERCDFGSVTCMSARPLDLGGPSERFMSNPALLPHPRAPVGPDVPAPPLVGDEAPLSAGMALRWKHQRLEVWSRAKPRQTKPN